MRKLFFLMLLTAFSSNALAKCSDSFHVISGAVVDARGAPVRGALVGVSWIEESQPGGPAMALTDGDGRYSVPIVFHTDSGFTLLGDRCDARLTRVSVSAYTPDMRSMPMLVPVGEASRIDGPRIQVDHPIEREPLWPEGSGADASPARQSLRGSA